MVKEKLVTRNMKVSELKVTTIATTPDGCKTVEEHMVTLPGDCSNKKKTRELLGNLLVGETVVNYKVIDTRTEKLAVTESQFLEMAFVVEPAK